MEIQSKPSIKKGKSNSRISKNLHIRSETVWKVIKKFKETG